MSALLLVLALAGFWPTYFRAVIGEPIAPTSRNLLIHVHAALFLGWLLAYMVQAALIARGRGALHRRIGPVLAAYGFAICAVGAVAGLALAARLGRRVGDPDQAAAFAFAPLIDVILVAVFLAVAVAFRAKPSVHGRAMLVATFSIAVVGIGRLLAAVPGIDSPSLWQPLTLSPLLLALGYDLAVERRAHAVLVAGIVLHGLRLNQELYTTTEAWLPIGRALVAPF
jgi:hypothetical protein